MAVSELVRRLKVFIGAGGRRTWSEDEGMAIVAERGRPGTSISAVACRRGLNAPQLFKWRCLARRARINHRQTELRCVRPYQTVGPSIIKRDLTYGTDKSKGS